MTIYFPKETIEKAIALLRDEGIFNDQNTPFGSYAIEHRFEEIKCDLEELGYNSDHLQMGGIYFEQHGAAYYVYDEEAISYEKAKSLIQIYVDKAVV